MFKSAAINSNIVVECGAPDRCAGLVGNYNAKVLFEQADSDAKAESCHTAQILSTRSVNTIRYLLRSGTVKSPVTSR
jgi:hypothetical protein